MSEVKYRYMQLLANICNLFAHIMQILIKYENSLL